MNRVAAHVAVAALRAEPTRRAERISEARCGEPLEVLEEARIGPDRWLRGRGEDGYAGWIAADAVSVVDDGWPGPDPFRVGARSVLVRAEDGGPLQRLEFGAVLLDPPA